MALNRHKPTSAQRAATHEANGEDYKKLAQAVVEAIVQKRRDIIFKIAYFAEIDPSIPKGILIKRDENYNYYRAKAFKLADWLHARGFLPADAKGIVLSTRDLVYREARLNKILIDNSRTDAYNERSVETEKEESDAAD